MTIRELDILPLTFLQSSLITIDIDQVFTVSHPAHGICWLSPLSAKAVQYVVVQAITENTTSIWQALMLFILLHRRATFSHGDSASYTHSHLCWRVCHVPFIICRQKDQMWFFFWVVFMFSYPQPTSWLCSPLRLARMLLAQIPV